MGCCQEWTAARPADLRQRFQSLVEVQPVWAQLADGRGSKSVVGWKLPQMS